MTPTSPPPEAAPPRPWPLARLTLAKDGALAGVAPDGSLIREPGEPFTADRGLDRMPA